MSVVELISENFQYIAITAVAIYWIIDHVGYRRNKQSRIDSLKEQLNHQKQLSAPRLLKHIKAINEGWAELLSYFEERSQQKDKEIAETQAKYEVAELKILDMEKQHAHEMLQLSTEVHHQVSNLFEGKVFQTSPPMISRYTQFPFQQNFSPDENIFPQPKKPDNGNDSDDTIPRSN